MTEAKHCPTCGASLARPADRAGPDVPPTPLLANGSSDDNLLGITDGQGLAGVEPDPTLGAFVPSSPSPEGQATLQVAAATSKGTSSANFPALVIDGPGTARPKPDPAPRVVDDLPDAGEDEVEERRTPWSTVLLASYASALTLALAWSWWKGGSRPKAEDAVGLPSPPSAVAPPVSARQAGLSRKVEPPEPILGEHFASFGRPLKVGSLEITPIDVRRQDVQLQRANTYASPARRDGGKKALILRLKLRNTTDDSAFAPLDQAYLRDRGQDVVDTFVEVADRQKVYPFPLALDSEWSIVGQDFSELRPGESRDVAIVTAPDAPPDSAGPFTWRVRLRTGIGRTDAIGVVWPDRSAPPKGI